MKNLLERINRAESLLKAGRAFEAYSILIKGLSPAEGNLEYRQVLALSLIRLGAAASAREVIESMFKGGARDPETAGIMGRIYKDLWKKNGNQSDARKSRDIYYASFRKAGDYYTGINAATMSLVLGEESKSRSIAKTIYSELRPENDYWVLATMGEACLILGRTDEAEEFYRRAYMISAGNFGNISSSNQQLTLISAYRKIPPEIIEWFKGPVIIVFSGNMLDAPGRGKPRFTEGMISYVREEIRNEIRALKAGISYSSAACGTDLIFIEEMKKARGEVNILLPFDIDDFITTSVGFAGAEWIQRFRKVLRGTNVQYITEEKYLGCDDLFSFTNQILIGSSCLRAGLFLSKPVLLAVADTGDRTAARGGTMEIVRNWKDRDNLRLIDLKKYPGIRGALKVKSEGKDSVYAKEKVSRKAKNGHCTSPDMPFGIRRLIKCILFADIVDYTKIEEQYTPYFMYELLEAISNKYKNLRVQPEVINTWGDAIFTVYESARDMMEFAIALMKTITDTDWSSKKLPSDLNIRISLHAGPIFMGMDSITNRLNAYGSHINRAARMEAVTVPGCIYASMQFASRLIYETGTAYNYEYVGIIELPKRFGRQEMFNIYRIANSTG